MTDHKSGVENLLETQLLGDVKRRAEQTRRRNLAIDQQRQAIEQQSAEV